MSKPMGMTATFQVVRPNHAQDSIWDAVAAAISMNMTPEQFKDEAAQAWEYWLREEAKHATEVLSK